MCLSVMPCLCTARAQMQLVHLVAVEAFDAALDVAAEANADVRHRDLQGAFPPIKDDTWPEAGTSSYPFTPMQGIVMSQLHC